MGNTVADWGKTDPTFRDRYKATVDNSTASAFWTTGGTPFWTQHASGSASRIVDHNNPWIFDLMRLRTEQPRIRNVDFGFPLALERTQLSMPSILDMSTKVSGSTYAYYKGVYGPSAEYNTALSQIAIGRFPTLSTSLGKSPLELWAYGSTAIAKSIPDVPKFSLFRFVGELREGLPKVPLKTIAKERKLRNAGGEYLNVQFGLLPTASDVQKLIESLMHPELRARVKHQLYEEHRVRKTLDKGRTTSTRALTGAEMSTLSGFSSGVTGTRTSTQEYKVWSSCSFAYYQVMELNRLLDEMDTQLGGFGIVPKAIDVWNLIPWSWFIDWFTNFNHVITNLSYLGRDGLILQHGYIMGHYTDVTTDSQYRTYMGKPISTTGTRLDERKYRVRASPFGFGLTWKDFDPFQLSILGALGVSRLRY